MEPISFIIPSRNNLSYLKMCYNSIRKNAGYRHEICFADDASSDGTWEWLQEIGEKDNLVKYYRNPGPEREGLTILYDSLVENVATTDRLFFFHSDMYLLPNAVEEIDKYLEEGVVVSLTRVEPPLHPAGPEKIIQDFGIEPEELKEQELLDWYNRYEPNPTGYFEEYTEGVFAPWAITRKDFEEIGGHDPLFRPQSKEDSDIFNRLHLNGVEFKQTWKGLVYHMTCRGSRFNPMAGGGVGKDSPEWLYTTNKNMREFIRKWGTAVQHDEMMKPIVSPVYSIGFELTEAADVNLIRALEPWCGYMVVPAAEEIEQYIKEEQPNTDYQLDKKLHTDLPGIPMYDIRVRFNPWDFTQESFNILQKLPDIIKDSGEEGQEFELDIFEISIDKMTEHQEDNIVCSSN
jgi:glycosyltransferase involved in cell wall biosynthesis